MIQCNVPENRRADYQALISQRRGTGTLSDLPFGCSVSYRGRNWIVGGYDTTMDVTTLRLVNRLCSVELSMVPAQEVTKNTGSQWQR